MNWRVPGDPEDAPAAGDAVAEACARAGLDPVACEKTKICVVEAINNALLHANRGREAEIEVRCRLQGDRILIEVTDHGPGMAGPLPSTAPDPCQEGGRGWFIIRQWMDEARYEQRAGENVLTMAKRIAG